MIKHSIHVTFRGTPCSNQLIVNTECACCKEEHIKHGVVGCTTLAPSDYTNRHNKVAGYIHWTICKHMGLQVYIYSRHTQQQEIKFVVYDVNIYIYIYTHTYILAMSHNGMASVKLIWGYRLMKSTKDSGINVSSTTAMWDVLVTTDWTILANCSDIVQHDKKGKTCLLIDIAIPDDSNINTKETEKLSKYKDMWIMVSRMWQERTKIVPVIIRALETIKVD